MTSAIGLFDSGLGGLSVLKALKAVLPQENFVYFADQANFPYGEKSKTQLIQCGRKAAQFLLNKEIKLLVIPCHTACAYLLPELEQELSIPVIGMIDPSISLIHSLPIQNQTLAILASQATIHSQVYQTRLKLNSSVRILPLACQELIGLIEANQLTSGYAETVAEHWLLKEKIQCMLLASTHFSLVTPFLQKIVGPDVELLDPVQSVVKAVLDALIAKTLMNPNPVPGISHFYSSKNSANDWSAKNIDEFFLASC